MRILVTRIGFVATLGLLLVSSSTDVQADALVVTRAMKASTIVELFVEDGLVRAEIEVGAADLMAFRNLLPDALYLKLTGQTRPLQQRLATFLEEDWVVRAGDRQLEGKIVSVVPRRRVTRDEITGEPLANQPLDAEVVIGVELHYALDHRPPTLAIRPPSGSPSGRAAANIGFVAYHQGVAVNDFRYLSQEETLRLDWSDPWYSRFERRTLLRRYVAPAAAFLYVENFEVRKEIVFRPKDLQTWVDLQLQGKTLIKDDQREAICRKAAAFLDERTPMHIDGQPVEGTLDRVNFIARTLRTSGAVEPGQDIDINTALIGAIYVYPIDTLPQRVTMEWDLFNERITSVPSVATDEAGGLPSQLEPGDATLTWQNFLTDPSVPAFMAVKPPPQPRSIPVPFISLLCVGLIAVLWIPRRHVDAASGSRSPLRVAVTVALTAVAAVALPWATPHVALPGANSAEIPQEDSRQISLGLLHNLYRAFDYRDESTIYDVLKRSVAGDLLNTIYLDTQQSLTLASQGGARVKVNDVQLVDWRAESQRDADGFLADCAWNVTGSVGHWGHIHQRTNQYRARLAVQVVDGQWKLTDMELLSEERR